MKFLASPTEEQARQFLLENFPNTEAVRQAHPVAKGLLEGEFEEKNGAPVINFFPATSDYQVAIASRPLVRQEYTKSNKNTDFVVMFPWGPNSFSHAKIQNENLYQDFYTLQGKLFVKGADGRIIYSSKKYKPIPILANLPLKFKFARQPLVGLIEYT
jgi:hypothetical protein